MSDGGLSFLTEMKLQAKDATITPLHSMYGVACGLQDVLATIASRVEGLIERREGGAVLLEGEAGMGKTRVGRPSHHCLSVCLSVCLPACLSVYLSVCLSVCLPACLPVCLSACLPV
jgi:hypothetical protein